MKANKLFFITLLSLAVFPFSLLQHAISLKSGDISVNSDNLSLSFSDKGDLIGVNVGNSAFPSKTGKTFLIKNTGKETISIFADSDSPLFFNGNKWNEAFINNTDSSINKNIMIDGKRLVTPLMESSNSEKINIEISAISKGESNSFITLSVAQYDSDESFIKDLKPVSFRFNTTTTEKNNFTNKRFSFSPSPLCKFISVSLTPSQGIEVFSCNNLSVWKIGSPLFSPVDLELISADKDKTDFSGGIENFGLAVSFEQKGKYIICNGNLKSLNNQEGAATVRFSLPISPDNLFWHDTLSDKRIIKGDTAFSNWHELGKGRFYSVYPFSLITLNNKGIAYAVPPQFPRIFRTGYSEDNGYFIEFDLGLSSETEKFPSSASFTFIIFAQDSEWGLRESAKKFYDFFPKSFEKINKKEGIWFAWLEPDKMYIPQDFGFMFDTTPDKSAYLDRYYGINFFYYQEPYGIGIEWEKNKHPNRIPENTSYEEILKKIKSKSFAEEKTFQTADGEKNYADAAIDSAMENEEGRYYLGYYKPYLFTNPDPDLSYGRLVTERVSHRQKNAETDRNSTAGQYIDSVVPAWWAIKENYKKEHFRYADIPLTFSYETGKPVELGLFQSYELFSAISEISRNNGGLVLTNTWYPMQTFYYGITDLIGAGEYSSDQPVAIFHYLRSVASKKTISFIDNELVEGNLSGKDIEKRFMKCLAFAVYPGAFPFRTPSDFERLRPFYKKYIPMINLISSQGWEPVTYAAASHPALNIERYGNPESNLYFTIYNPTDKDIPFTLEIQDDVSGKLNDKNIFSYNLISGSARQFTSLGEKHLIQLIISPAETILLQAGTKENIFTSRLMLAGQLSQSLGNFFIESSQGRNLLKNISKQKNSEFEYDGNSPSISAVKIENAQSGETSVFRMSAKPSIRKTDYRIDAEYFIEDKNEGEGGYISKMHCLLYSIAKFLSPSHLPDITAEVLITDNEGVLIKDRGLKREELRESSETTIFSRKFYVPSDSSILNIVFRIQGNFHSLHLKDVKIYPAGTALTVYREKDLIEELNSRIKSFYTDSASQELFNKLSDDLLSGKQSAEDILLFMDSVSRKADEHLKVIQELNEKLTAQNKTAEEYISRLQNFIEEIESTEDFIAMLGKR